MEISSNSSLDDGYRSGCYRGVSRTTVVPVLAAVLEAQNESRLARQALYMQRKVSKQCYLLEGDYIRGALRIFENKPPPQSTAEKGGPIVVRIWYIPTGRKPELE